MAEHLGEWELWSEESELSDRAKDHLLSCASCVKARTECLAVMRMLDEMPVPALPPGLTDTTVAAWRTAEVRRQLATETRRALTWALGALVLTFSGIAAVSALGPGYLAAVVSTARWAAVFTHTTVVGPAIAWAAVGAAVFELVKTVAGQTATS